jgi:hypothetical protein
MADTEQMGDVKHDEPEAPVEEHQGGEESKDEVRRAFCFIHTTPLTTLRTSPRDVDAILAANLGSIAV